MALRISGITLQDNKCVEIALTGVYGVGSTLSRKVLAAVSVDGSTRVKDLTESEATAIRDMIEGKYRVEGDLRREQATNIRRLKDIGSYRGTRHTRGLPARGQRTKTNTRTVRGNVRRTAGSGKRAAPGKT